MEFKSNGGGLATVVSVSLSLIAIVSLMACHKPTGSAAISKLQASDSADVNSAPTALKKKKKKKRLYLTFDDGPNKGTTNVLHIAQDEDVPISFFIVGEHVFGSAFQSQLWDSLKTAEDVELCNHSFSHAHSAYAKYYMSPDGVVKDFERTRDTLGLINNIGRTPGRNIWRIDTLQYTDLNKSAAAADSLQKAGLF